MIRQSNVVIFAPFVNKEFKNNWGDSFRIDSDDCNISNNDAVERYYQRKENYFGHKRDNYLEDISQWWANGNIICNQHVSLEDEQDKDGGSQYWGDAFLLQIKDMIAEACRLRNVSTQYSFILFIMYLDP